MAERRFIISEHAVDLFPYLLCHMRILAKRIQHGRHGKGGCLMSSNKKRDAFVAYECLGHPLVGLLISGQEQLRYQVVGPCLFRHLAASLNDTFNKSKELIMGTD